MSQEPITLETINPLIHTGPVGGIDTLNNVVSLLHLMQDSCAAEDNHGVNSCLQVCASALEFIIKHGKCEIPDMGSLTGSLEQAEDVVCQKSPT